MTAIAALTVLFLPGTFVAVSLVVNEIESASWMGEGGHN